MKCVSLYWHIFQAQQLFIILQVLQSLQIPAIWLHRHSHHPWPVRKQFIRDHVWRGRLKPGCRIVGSVTIVWLTTEADDQSSLHCMIVSTDVICDRIGRRDASRVGGCSKTFSIHRANLDGLRWSEAYCLLPLYSVEKEMQHCWALAAMRAVWVASSLKSGALDNWTASLDTWSVWSDQKTQRMLILCFLCRPIHCNTWRGQPCTNYIHYSFLTFRETALSAEIWMELPPLGVPNAGGVSIIDDFWQITWYSS